MSVTPSKIQTIFQLKIFKMINFILFHKNSKLPGYIVECIRQIITTQINFKVYLLTDNNITFDNNNINVIDINDIKIDILNEIDFYKHDRDPLWKTSFERFFYIDYFIRKNKLKNIVHFDNDVLIYKAVEDILTPLQKNIPNVGITKHKPHELVCGFTFINNENSLEKICFKLLELAQQGVDNLKILFNGDMPHEMRLLGHISENWEDIKILPSTPFDLDFSNYDCVFDPSSYGQYLGGTGNAIKNTIHPDNVYRLVDRHIVNKKIIPIFDQTTKTPYIIYNDTHIPIFNLHIHSKQLREFITI
jgi:hypothetical protein